MKNDDLKLWIKIEAVENAQIDSKRDRRSSDLK